MVSSNYSSLANLIMSTEHPYIYCGDACQDAIMVRSCGESSECRKTWNGQSTGDKRHY